MTSGVRRLSREIFLGLLDALRECVEPRRPTRRILLIGFIDVATGDEIMPILTAGKTYTHVITYLDADGAPSDPLINLTGEFDAGVVTFPDSKTVQLAVNADGTGTGHALTITGQNADGETISGQFQLDVAPPASTGKPTKSISLDGDWVEVTI